MPQPEEHPEDANPPPSDAVERELRFWTAEAERRRLEGQLRRLEGSRGFRALRGWWKLQAGSRRVLTLARGHGKPQRERVGILLRLLREQGPRELAGELRRILDRGVKRAASTADDPPLRVPHEGPLFSVLMPVKDPEPAWLATALASVHAQSYGRWELVLADDSSRSPEVQRMLRAAAADPRVSLVKVPQPGGISRGLNVALAAAAGEWVAVLDHDDALAPCALAWLATCAGPEVDGIYSDEDQLDELGQRVEPFFKPDWSPDYLLSTCYLGHLCAWRRELLDAVGGYRSAFDGAHDFDLALRIAPRARRIEHVPRVLYHWRRSGGSTAAGVEGLSDAQDAGLRALSEALPAWEIDGHVEHVRGVAGGYRVRVTVPDEVKVAVIVPTRDRVDLLRACLESVAKVARQNVEVIVVDNGSRDPATLRYLETQTVARVLSRDVPFNFAYLINQGVAATDADVVCLLNNDTTAVTPEWLDAMLEALWRPGVGVVGARLVYPDGALQHAGVLLGVGQIAGHAYFGRQMSEPKPGRRPDLIGNFSAVTGACLMVRRADFLAADGLDEEHLPNTFGDIDLCLRLAERGLRTVYTPFATLVHHEGASRGRAIDRAAMDALRRRHPLATTRDPYANPHYQSVDYPEG